MRIKLSVVFLTLVFISGGAIAGAYEDWRDAMASHRKSDYDTAIALYSKAINAGTYAGKALGQLYHMRGKAKFQKHGVRIAGPDMGLRQAAVDDLTASLKLDPSDAEIYNERGAAYGKMKRREEALADFSKAIELRPGDFWPYNNRCLVYAELGRKEEAIRDCKKAAEIDPKHWQPKQTLQRLGAPEAAAKAQASRHFKRGREFFRAGSDAEALQEFDQAIALDPLLDAAYYLKGNTLLRMQRADEAIAQFDRALELYQNASGYAARAQAYMSRAKALRTSEWHERAKVELAKALSDLDKSVALAPKDARFWAVKAGVHFMLGEEARGCLAAKRACALGDCGISKEFSERTE